MTGAADARQRRLGALLRAIAPVDDEAIEALAALTREQEFTAGASLLRAGEVASDCFLVLRGLVREFYLDADGDEQTRAFVAEGGVTGSLLDLLRPEPALTWIAALEETEVLAFRYAAFDALTARHPALQLIARRNAEALYLKKTLREHEMLALGAGERYARWMAANPTLDARVSRRHLASYLGITPEHLSRLRRPRAAARRTPRPPGGARR